MKYLGVLLMIIFASFTSASLTIEGVSTDRTINLDAEELLTFLGLEDTPASYSGQAGLCATVNSAEDAIEFGNCSNQTFTDGLYVDEDGDTMTGNLTMNGATAIEFRDKFSYIYSSTGFNLDLVGTFIRMAGTVIYVGTGSAANVGLNFDTSGADGSFNYIGASDYFQFNDDLLMANAESSYYRQYKNNITSPATDNMWIGSPNLTVNAPVTFLQDVEGAGGLWDAQQDFEDDLNVTENIIFETPTINITSNATCIIINGDTSVLEIC